MADSKSARTSGGSVVTTLDDGSEADVDVARGVGAFEDAASVSFVAVFAVDRLGIARSVGAG
jgi:hypothetical protein